MMMMMMKMIITCVQGNQRGMDRRIVAQLSESIDYIFNLRTEGSAPSSSTWTQGGDNHFTSGCSSSSGSNGHQNTESDGLQGASTDVSRKSLNTSLDKFVVLIVAVNKCVGVSRQFALLSLVSVLYTVSVSYILSLTWFRMSYLAYVERVGLTVWSHRCVVDFQRRYPYQYQTLPRGLAYCN